MELWYSEFHTENVKLSVRINRQLFSGESEFQRIDVFESEEFGRFVALDGEIVFSDKDEFIYDEMVTHVPMTVHPNVKNVLIIGGGDGGVARELIHYPQIESIDVVESDKMFVDVCAEMFPDIAQGLKDERVNIYYEDGLRFLRNKKARYDLIINDSTDPLGHTEGLFTKEFYGSCYKALRDDGIMVYQHGSPFYSEDKDKAMLNAGYILEQLALFLCTKGLGTCFLGNVKPKFGNTNKGNMKCMIMMAFGKSRGAHTRKPSEAKRMSLQEL